jgi:ArsR family transcriptional regulator, arsenate/arsenite/antimonite-responsive transcriptional repressor
MPKTLDVMDLDLTSPTCCSPLTDDGRLSAQAALEVAVRLKALADPVRLQIISLLLCAPGKELCTCDLAPAVGIKDATVSHHLKQLLETGLVSKRRDGMNVYYRIEPETLRALARVLDVDCC